MFLDQSSVVLFFLTQKKPSPVKLEIPWCASAAVLSQGSAADPVLFDPKIFPFPLDSGQVSRVVSPLAPSLRPCAPPISVGEKGTQIRRPPLVLALQALGRNPFLPAASVFNKFSRVTDI